MRTAPGSLGAGLLMGLIFAAEFLFLFLALDLTTVVRTSIIFYSMPVWLALMAHVGLPGERITRTKAVGLAHGLCRNGLGDPRSGQQPRRGEPAG